MHAYIITGGSPAQRQSRIDTFVKTYTIAAQHLHEWTGDEGITMGVTDVRSLMRTVQLAPAGGNYTLILIRRADNLTVQAQNALLKTLEEPPKHAIIVLETENPDALLPTVQSRCMRIALGATDISQPDPDMVTTLKTLLTAPDSQKIAVIDTVATSKQTAEAWVDRALGASHALLHHPQWRQEAHLSLTDASSIASNLLAARHLLRANVSYKLACEYPWIHAHLPLLDSANPMMYNGF